MRRQMGEVKHVSHFDRRGTVSECCRSFRNVVGRRKWQTQLPESVLDDDLPCPCGREIYLVLVIAEQLLGFGVELLGGEQGPRPAVRVDPQLHSSLSNERCTPSGTGAAKSSASH